MNAPSERSIGFEQVNQGWREELARVTEQLVISRAMLAAAEEECADLRLRVAAHTE